MRAWRVDQLGDPADVLIPPTPYVEHGGRPVIEAAHDDLLRLYRAGTITPDIEATVALDDVQDGLARLADRKVIGRLVLTPGAAGAAVVDARREE